MNLLKTTDNGGFPLMLNDFRWIDQGYREAFKAMMSGYGVDDSTAVIISGCERTVASGTVTIAAGFISIGGEICLVPSHTYPEPTIGQVEYWDLFNTFDPNGLKVFQSTLDYDTYQVRVGKITVASALPAGYTTYSDTKNIFQITRVKINTDSWHNMLTDTDDFLNEYAIDFKKDSSEFVHFRGFKFYEDPTPGAVNELIGTLPVGYRPEVKKEFVICSKTDSPTSGEINFVTGVIETNGEVRIKSIQSAPGYVLDFSQITPFEGV